MLWKDISSFVYFTLFPQYILPPLGLRQLLKIKNQELRQMKSLAGTILDQRSETEQFFMEALNEVEFEGVASVDIKFWEYFHLLIFMVW